MGKPISSLTTAITIRLPNELLESIGSYAEAQGLINQSGRFDKRGQPNLSAAVSTLLKQALEQSEQPITAAPEKLSDSVISPSRQSDVDFAELENRLIERVQETVAQQLEQFLGNSKGANGNSDMTSDRSNRTSDSKIAPASDFQADTEDTRDRILHAASRGFRSHGYNGIGVNTLAKDAGVTSGAFYGYFRSKEDAFIAAVTDGLAEYRANIKAFQTNHGDDWAVALADYYVSRQHRQDLACGCALPTLSPEVIRADRRVRTAYQSELIKLNETVAAGLPNGTATDNQNTAWVILSLLAGGLTLARAVWDEALAEQISGAIRDATTAIAFGELRVFSETPKI
jgi:AcrR family transcriptional regulator